MLEGRAGLRFARASKILRVRPSTSAFPYLATREGRMELQFCGRRRASNRFNRTNFPHFYDRDSSEAPAATPLPLCFLKFDALNRDPVIGTQASSLLPLVIRREISVFQGDAWSTIIFNRKREAVTRLAVSRYCFTGSKRRESRRGTGRGSRLVSIPFRGNGGVEFSGDGNEAAFRTRIVPRE